MDFFEPRLPKNVNFPDGEMLESYVAMYYEPIINELLLAILETANAESAGQYRSDWFFFDSRVSSERQIVQLMREEQINQDVLIFINRLQIIFCSSSVC